MQATLIEDPSIGNLADPLPLSSKTSKAPLSNQTASHAVRSPAQKGVSALIGTTTLNTFYFSGAGESLKERIEGMDQDERESMTDALINVSGRKLQGMNTMSILCTMIWGGLLLFPLLFLFSNWWKKCTHPLYQIDNEVYKAICLLLKAPNLNSISIRVADNGFDQEKALILKCGVSESKLQRFNLVNVAGEYGLRGEEHRKFIQNISVFKQCKTRGVLRWGNKKVE